MNQCSNIRFWHKILSRQSFDFTVEWPNFGQFWSIICCKMCIFVKSKCLFLTKFFLFSEWISFWKLFHWIHAIAEVLSNRFRSIGFDLFDWVWKSNSHKFQYLAKYFNLLKFCWNYHSNWLPRALSYFLERWALMRIGALINKIPFKGGH